MFLSLFFGEFLCFYEGQTLVVASMQKSIFLMNENYLLVERAYLCREVFNRFTLCIYYASVFWTVE